MCWRLSDRSGSVTIRSDMPDAAKGSLQYFLKSLQVNTSNFFFDTTQNYQQYILMKTRFLKYDTFL